MPNHSIKMIKLRQVFGLYGSGYGSRSISTTLGISRTTIRKYLRIFNESYAPIWPPTKSLFKGFDACGLPANHSAKGLAFPRLAKVVSRMVWN